MGEIGKTYRLLDDIEKHKSMYYFECITHRKYKWIEWRKENQDLLCLVP